MSWGVPGPDDVVRINPGHTVVCDVSDTIQVGELQNHGILRSAAGSMVEPQGTCVECRQLSGPQSVLPLQLRPANAGTGMIRMSMPPEGGHSHLQLVAD